MNEHGQVHDVIMNQLVIQQVIISRTHNSGVLQSAPPPFPSARMFDVMIVIHVLDLLEQVAVEKIVTKPIATTCSSFLSVLLVDLCILTSASSRGQIDCDTIYGSRVVVAHAHASCLRIDSAKTKHHDQSEQSL